MCLGWLGVGVGWDNAPGATVLLALGVPLAHHRFIHDKPVPLSPVP